MSRKRSSLFAITTGPKLREKIFFRVSHPFIPTLIFSLSVFGLIYFAQQTRPLPLWKTLGCLGIGLILWTLVEYLLHRFLFHWTQVAEPWRSLFSGLHMAHHRDPQEKSLIIAPPLVSLLSSLMLYALCFVITWNSATSALLLAGIQIAYIYYEWVHYGVHEFRPRTPWSRYQKRYHLTHHSKKPKEVFGVTVPFWDWVFGTRL